VERTHGRVVDIGSGDDLDHRLARGARTLGAWRVRGVDLHGRVEALLERDLRGAAFVGCRLDPADAERLDAAGALVVPAVEVSPLEVDRTRLYTARELYDTEVYAESLDARAYAWVQQGPSRERDRTAALHDHGIDEALRAWCGDRRLAGVMGGHAADRGAAAYAGAAHLGRLLAHDGATVATGGGPGAMEAANLGARFAHADRAHLDDALATLSTAPSFRPSVEAWLTPAWSVLGEAPEPDVDTLGVPTWHYGHEPPNPFATAIAKYVRNATREAVLLEICSAGIVVLPGAAGTVQEIFQDACENYYADEASVAPMVLVGRDHWTAELPAWPLLQALSRGRAMEDHVHLVDDVEEAAALLRP